MTPNDVVTAMGSQNLILPSGTMKIGQFEYQVDLNSSPQTIEELNALPIKSLPNGTTIYVRDVANVRNGFIPQTNVVRFDGSRDKAVTYVGHVSDINGGAVGQRL